MKARLLAVLIPGLLLAADKADDHTDKERQGLQGAWMLVSAEADSHPLKDVQGKTLTFAGDKVTTTQPGKAPEESFFKLGTGKHIDLICKDPDGKDLVLRGIYQLKEGKLTLC